MVGDQVVGFKVPHQPFVDHALEGLAEAAEQADGSILGFLLGVCVKAFVCLIYIVSVPGSLERGCDKYPLLLLLLYSV